MKTFLTIVLLCIAYISINAQSLGIIESENPNDIYELFNQKDITVHFYKDDCAIISGDYKNGLQYSLLEENGFDNEYNYFIQYVNEKELLKLKESISDIGEILYMNQTKSILKINKNSISRFKPIKNDALIYVDENEAYIADKYQSKLSSEVSFNNDIASMLNEVDTNNIEATISYLSSYTTRDCFSTDVVNALNWINSTFESYGLNVTSQSLSSYDIPSFNVIATQTGTTIPDEYIVVGGHADSRSSELTAPGADDNASGVAGVLEIARILSNYTFDRTIVYCAFSGEEYGLFGSKYFANDFKNNNKNIIGYVNLDMIGYKHSSQTLHTSLIYPASAQTLANYYKTICSTYLPNFGVIDGTLSSGSSDHASFNSMGYMGIFPFEDVNNYSHYIHSSNDILGLSVNNLELAENLTQAALATVASLANNGYTLSNENNLIDSNYFTIYPNPATTDLNIRFDGQQSIDVELYNILGELVFEKTIEASENINISKLTPGTYFVKLTSEECSTVKKCIIK
ncbi:MAG: M28 family peptidase [Bacteroidales bacterium]|nr:M28 family peptidase [Bacteroidales bacterium]